jgi:mono/diheme cytochrome c family protein
MLKRMAATMAVTIGLWMPGLAGAQTPPAADLPAPTGNAAHGKELFEKTLRCYACHGFDAQSGSPRLVPMRRTQELFLAYVRKPATPGMPSFADVPERDLSDVYAYIRSIPQAGPPVDAIPILKAIIERRTKAN